jgi:hypothetical protein
MNIVEVLIPDAYKLKKLKGGGFKSIIVDEELDPFNVKLYGDDCIQIDTDEMGYITLSISTLYEIIDLIEEAQFQLSKKTKK